MIAHHGVSRHFDFTPVGVDEMKLRENVGELVDEYGEVRLRAKQLAIARLAIMRRHWELER